MLVSQNKMLSASRTAEATNEECLAKKKDDHQPLEKRELEEIMAKGKINQKGSQKLC